LRPPTFNLEKIMADITMCEGEGCPLRDNCYRFTAKPNPDRQSYFVETPVSQDGKCVHFFDNADMKNSRAKK